MSDVGLVASEVERAPLGRGLCMVGRQRGKSGVRCQELMQAAPIMISNASRRAIDGEVDLPEKSGGKPSTHSHKVARVAASMASRRLPGRQYNGSSTWT